MIYLSERQRCGPRGSVEACGTLLSILPLGNATTVRALLCGAFLPEKSTSAGMRALTAALKALKQLPLWTWENLPTRTRRTRVWDCMLGWKNASLCREKPYRCCRCACHAELTVSSGTARPSFQNDSNLPAVATCPCSGPPADKQEGCPPP